MEDTVLADLPDEVLLEVFSRLPLADAVTCALHVCAHWRRLFRFRAPWRGRTYEAPDEAQAEEAYLVARMLSTGRDLTLEAGNRFCLRATEDSVTVRWDIFQQEKFELLTAGSRVRSLSIPGDFLVWSNVTSLARLYVIVAKKRGETPKSHLQFRKSFVKELVGVVRAQPTPLRKRPCSEHGDLHRMDGLCHDIARMDTGKQGVRHS